MMASSLGNIGLRRMFFSILMVEILMLFFSCRVALQEEQNQMNAANLGIVFGPTLLRPE